MSWLSAEEERIFDNTENIMKALRTILEEERANADRLVDLHEDILELQAAVAQLQLALAPPPAARFSIQLTKGVLPMAGKARAVNALDITILPNGTATAAIVFEDASGNVTTNVPSTAATATWAASDATPGPSVLTLAPSADGKTCLITVTLPTPPPSPLPTGLTVAATIASGLDGQTAPETEVSQGLDVTPAPPGVASKFVLALTEP